MDNFGVCIIEGRTTGNFMQIDFKPMDIQCTVFVSMSVNWLSGCFCTTLVCMYWLVLFHAALRHLLLGLIFLPVQSYSWQLASATSHVWLTTLPGDGACINIQYVWYWNCKHCGHSIQVGYRYSFRQHKQKHLSAFAAHLSQQADDTRSFSIPHNLLPNPRILPSQRHLFHLPPSEKPSTNSVVTITQIEKSFLSRILLATLEICFIQRGKTLKKKWSL